MKFPQNLYRCFLILAFGSLMSLSSWSQDLKPAPKHPGDTLRYDVKLEGVDKDKFISARLIINRHGDGHPDQKNLPSSWAGDSMQKGPDETFHLSAKVPELIASGEYDVLVQIFSRDNVLAISYGSTQTEPIMPPLPTVRIENDTTVHNPRMVVTPLP